MCFWEKISESISLHFPKQKDEDNMPKNPYVHLLVLSGLFMFCTAAFADTCYEQYRLLDECTEKYPSFIAAPPTLTDDISSDSKAGLSSGISLSPRRGGQEFSAMGKGLVQTRFGASFSSPTTSYRNSEVYRAHGLFDLKITQGYQGG